MRAALVAGATGLVGSYLIKLLLANDNYQKIISIGRRKLAIENDKLEQHIVDFENLTNLELKADDVFCCLGTTIKKAGSKEAFKRVDFEYPNLLAKYAASQGASSYHLISAMGANSKSSIFYNSVKGEIENELNKLEIPQRHVYRPSLLLGERVDKRTLEKMGGLFFKAASFLFVGPLKNYKAITAERVAENMLLFSLSDKKGFFIHPSGEMQ